MGNMNDADMSNMNSIDANSTAEEVGSAARTAFLEGLNCSQSVVSVFADILHFDAFTVLKAASPFGGGTCRMREMCGAVTGALMCLGLATGSPDGNKDKRDALYKAGQELCRRFKALNGSVICRELLGLAPMGESDALAASGKVNPHIASEPTSSPRTKEYYKSRPCPDKCKSAAEVLMQMLCEMHLV